MIPPLVAFELSASRYPDHFTIGQRNSVPFGRSELLTARLETNERTMNRYVLCPGVAASHLREFITPYTGARDSHLDSSKGKNPAINEIAEHVLI